MSPFRKKIEVRRYPEGAYVNGEWNAGDPETLHIQMSIQPARPEQLQVLPEGQRTSQAIICFSDEQLLTVSEEDQRAADEIYNPNDGNWYQVQLSEPNQSGVVSHFRTIATRENVS